MRLLLRANAHRSLDTGATEIAASPDTPLRERWQWHVRLHDEAPALAPDALSATVARGDGTSSLLEVSADPGVARPVVELLEVAARAQVRRTPDELVLLLVNRGAALVEQRHLLAELDAMVFEGDDPLEVSVDSAHGPLEVAVVRLRPAVARPLAWVP